LNLYTYCDNNPIIYIDPSGHKKNKIIVDYFVNVNLVKTPYIKVGSSGSYVLQSEKWLKNLGFNVKVDGKFSKTDAAALTQYEAKNHLKSTNGIIDNKTYSYLMVSNLKNAHKNDVKKGVMTQIELNNYNTYVDNQLKQPQYQNPDYTKDFYAYNYNKLTAYFGGGVEIYSALISLYPGGDAVDIATLANDIVNYQEGDEWKLVADLAALGIDGAGNFADEIIDAAKQAKKAARLSKGASKTGLLNELANSGVKYNADDIVSITKTSNGKLVWLENGNANAGLEHIMNHADEFAAKGISKNQISGFVMDALENGKIVGYQGKGTGRPIYEVVYNGVTQRVAITTGSNGFIVGANPVSIK
jgi:peptidoglycan hydrolase-like protein with peptidoglycan-binding domain